MKQFFFQLKVFSNLSTTWSLRMSYSNKNLFFKGNRITFKKKIVLMYDLFFQQKIIALFFTTQQPFTLDFGKWSFLLSFKCFFFRLNKSTFYHYFKNVFKFTYQTQYYITLIAKSCFKVPRLLCRTCKYTFFLFFLNKH